MEISAVIPNTTRRCWSKITQPMARGTCRSLRKTCFNTVDSKCELTRRIIDCIGYNWQTSSRLASLVERATSDSRDLSEYRKSIDVKELAMQIVTDRLLAHPHRRSVTDQSRARTNPRRSATADAHDGVDAVLPLGSGGGRQRHARHDPPAPVLEGRTRLDHDAGGQASPSTSA